MTTTIPEAGAAADAPARRARVAVLGEFSAGKSTFINLVTGGKALRTQVTATQMPAVWLSHGTDTPYRVGLDGTESPVDPGNPSSISVADTAYLRVFMETPILELCDLIDTPGNGDPNIAPVAWERVAAVADVAVWCSPATQAWRQSEAAAWARMPQRLRENGVLLLTRADKLVSDADRDRVLRRVTAEAAPMFSSIHMVSLLNLTLVKEALRQVIALCRNVEMAETPGALDTAQILRTMSADVPAPPAMPEPGPTEDGADVAFATAEADAATALPIPTEGYATALWYSLTDGLPTDDPEALDRAFGRFLERLDGEIAALRKITTIGKAV